MAEDLEFEISELPNTQDLVDSEKTPTEIIPVSADRSMIQVGRHND
ncbi:MAG: hypothetical protein OEM26_03305 [Saprospiraceae bacterium]|nr:hypothetical protein [Saprospiraceae bacterium]